MEWLERWKNYLLKCWKELFCYLLIFLGILLFVVVLIVKPQKTNNAYLYDNTIESEKKTATFPIVQHIKVSEDNVYGMFLYFGSDDINQYPYKVTLKDIEGKKYFKHDFNLDYESNIVYMQFPLIKESKGKEFIITIDCSECDNVQLGYRDSKEKTNYIENNDKVLGISFNYYVENHSFNWYSILSIIIGLILLPLAKEENHEK